MNHDDYFVADLEILNIIDVYAPQVELSSDDENKFWDLIDST